MTEPNFGIVYNVVTLDPDSIVLLAGWSSTGTFLTDSTLGSYIPRRGSEGPVMYISDNQDEREFAFISTVSGNKRLIIYDVSITGTPSLVARNSTIFTTTLSPSYHFGIRKLSDSSYYLYYSGIITSGSNYYYQLRRVAITPGGGSSDSLLQEIYYNQSGYGILNLAPVGPEVNAKVGYFGFIKAYPSTNYPYGYDLDLYSIDMETESIVGGTKWQSGGTALHYKSYMDAGTTNPVSLNFSNGKLHWCAFYIDAANGTGGGAPLISHIVIDGVDTKIYDTVSNQNPVTYWSYQGFSDVGQYNSLNFLTSCDFVRTPSNGETHRVLIDQAGNITTIFDPPANIAYQQARSPSFGSPHTYPSMVFYTGSYYWVDPTNGQVKSAVTIPGVTTIYNVFPTLDNQNGAIYMYVLLGDATKWYISVDPSSHTMISTLAEQSFSSTFDGSFNHGNFFIRWSSSVIRIDYFVNMVDIGINEVQMIIEQN